jgi:DNA-binding CsgD family transcriptional regulator
MTIRSALDAYAGMAEEARRTAQVALDASNRSEGRELRGWLLANIGFLEVSLGNYRSALTLLQPVVDSLFSDPDYSEIIVASCVSDAVEAMIHVNRLDDAQRLTELVERNAIRLDRAWMLAVGGRCRGMLLAALGDLAGAASAAETAMQQHDRVPMPFERARTLLLLGQLQRRQRKKETSVTTIREALAVFEKLGTPIWADRARAELDRSSVGRKRGAGLTPSEQRVAELAASGMTTRDVAATLFMSPKTVEANLGRIYRKLGIRSRVELGQHLRSPDMPPFNQ